MKELQLKSRPGIPMLIGLLLGMLAAVVMLIRFASSGQVVAGLLMLIALIVIIVMLCGFYTVEPNQSVVVSLFGKYIGSVHEQGLRWNNPFYGEKKVSLRYRNFESGKLKVNELDGSPIEIAAIVVWRVVDSAEAVFNVDDYESYVHIQSESAIRAMATSYPYDQHEEDQMSLRSHPAEISAHLQREIQDRMDTAGVEVLETRISHLAYAPEIAHAMLQRQQANAVVAARTRIVFGAVSMVEMALEELTKKNVVELDDERRAQMVSNLLVVLCSDRGTQPIVNAGSIY